MGDGGDGDLFHSAVVQAPVGMLVAGADGACELVNERWCELTGLPAAQSLGDGWRRAIHPADAAELADRWRSLLETGDPFEQRHRLCRPDGVVRWVRARARPLLDEEGRVHGYAGAFADITELNEREAELQVSEARLRGAMDTALDAFVTIDADGFVAEWNPQAEVVFGWSADEARGRRVDQLVMPERYRADHRAGLRRYLETGGTKYLARRIELEAMRRDGSEFPVELSVTPVETGGPVIFSAFIRDISERKRAERELRELTRDLERRVAERTTELRATVEELEAFSYSVSHDLRAPLHSIAGFAEALREDYGEGLDERAHDYLGRVRSATRRMGQLIDDLLALSQISRKPLERSTVDLSGLAGQVAAELREADPRRDVEIAVQGGLRAEADDALVRVVLENLLGNAWKFTSHQATARIQFEAADGGAFVVRDDGVGFDPAYADKLFGPFQRLHRQGEFEGTGVGLATVQRVVRRHAGEVWAESEPGEGAAFYFRLGPGPGAHS